MAEHLARRPEVGRVVCLFPPIMPVRRYAFPVRAQGINTKLILLHCLIRAVSTDRAPFRLRRWVNAQIIPVLHLFLRGLGLRGDNTVLWIFPPLPAPHIDSLLRRFPDCPVITQVVDNFMARDAKERDTLRDLAVEQYRALSKISSSVVVGSRVMHEYFSGLQGQPILMENAVDSRFIAEATELPCRARGAAPRLGYVGFITERTDIGLLECIARSRPDWHLVLAGAVHGILPESIQALVSLPNVEYLGHVVYDELPGLMASFDVCLIPHKDTPLSRSMSPLKFFQYLGSGRPIVSTPVAGVDRFRDHCFIATTCAEFISQIEVAIRVTTTEASKQRIEAARTETWEARLSDLWPKVQQRFGR